MKIKGFWSYSRSDATHEGSRLNALQEEIEAELGLILGDEVSLFVDTSDIRVGDDWRLGLYDALRDAAFMMPVFTPRYFKSRECRGELIYFIEGCRKLKIQPMIFPIYLVNVWGFNSRSKDSLKREASKLQHLDFRGFRSAEELVLRRIVQEYCLDVLERMDATYNLQQFFDAEEAEDASEIYESLDRAKGG